VFHSVLLSLALKGFTYFSSGEIRIILNAHRAVYHIMLYFHQIFAQLTFSLSYSSVALPAGVGELYASGPPIPRAYRWGRDAVPGAERVPVRQHDLGQGRG